MCLLRVSPEKGFPSKDDLLSKFRLEDGYIFPSEALFSRLLHEIGWKISGRNMVSIPLEMQSLFTAPLTDVFPSDLKFPTHAMTVYIALPGTTMEIWGDERTGKHRIRGVFISRMKFEGSSREGFAIFINGHNNENSLEPMDDANFWFNISAEDRHGSLETLLQQGTNPDTEDLSPEQRKHLQFSAAASMKAVRIALNALLHLGDPPHTLAKREEEMAEVAKSLGRMKNQNKGKARRLQKRMADLIETHIVWDLPSVGKGRWKRGRAKAELVEGARADLRSANTATKKAKALLALKEAMSLPDETAPTLTWEAP